MKQPRMNIVDATLILRKGEGEGGGRGVLEIQKKN